MTWCGTGWWGEIRAGARGAGKIRGYRFRKLFQKDFQQLVSGCGFSSLFLVVDSNGWFQNDGFRKLVSKR
jgi:hypothetical protein